MPLWLARRTCIPRSLPFEAHRGPQCFATQGQSDRWRTTHSWMNAVIKTLLFREKTPDKSSLSSHYRLERCLRRVRERVHWQWMNENIKTFISKFDISRSVDPKQLRETLNPYDMTHRPLAKVETDLFSFQNKDCVITLDYYSNFWGGGLFARHKEQHSHVKIQFCPRGKSGCLCLSVPISRVQSFQQAMGI